MANTSSYDIVDGNRVDNPTDDTTYVFYPSATLKTFSLGGDSDGDIVAVNALSSDFKVRVRKNEMTLIGLDGTPSAGVLVKVQFDSTGGANKFAFLDGTVEATYTPNAPGALRGTWTFGDTKVVKRLNLSRENVSYAIDSSNTFADEAYEASGALESQRYVLTTEMDDIEITTDNTYDTVRGIIDVGGEDGDISTITPLDTIIGNGNTLFEVGVHDVNCSYEADYIRLDGVDKISVIDAYGTGILNMDAVSYGTDISHIGLEGRGGLDVCIDNLTVEGSLTVVNANDDSNSEVEGTIDGLNFQLDIDNCSSDTSEITFGVAGISMESGKDGEIELCLSQSATGDCADQAVGNITIGNVNVVVGSSADDTLTIENYACAGTSGDATVGNISVGAIDIDIGYSGDFSMFVCNTADADEGNAVAGNITLGALSATLANCADITEYYVCNIACADTGDATVGNITIGDMVISGGDDACLGSFSFTNYACAADGNATAGNVTIGAITVTGGDDSCFSLESYNSAFAYGTGHNMTMGTFTIGAMNIELGNGSCFCVTASNYGSASCGDAIAGDFTIGDLNLVLASSACVDLCYSNDIDAGNSATSGKMTIGDINVAMGGIDNSFTYDATNNACGGTASAAGDMTVGNIDVYGGADAYVCFEFDQCAYEGHAGNVTFGDVSIQIENEGSNSSGSAYFCVSVSGASVGNVTIGDLSLTGAECACLSACVYVNASEDNIGNLVVGDISFDAGVSGSAYLVYSACAEDDMGNVSYGNVNLDASDVCASACVYIWNSADYGSMGNITMGDITLSAGEDADVTLCASWSASDEIGAVSFGNIALNAVGEDADAELALYVYNCDDIGNVVYGDISLTVDGEDACACAYLTVSNDDNHDIGTITAGDINMAVSGVNASGYLCMTFTSADTIGQTTIGNINIDLNIDTTDAAALSSDTAEANIYICSDAGDLTVGNITLSAAEVTADFDDNADVSAYVQLCASSSGDLVLGNITVSGGYDNSAGDADDFTTLTSWLDLNGDSITVGNIDYSGYLGTATIDASGWDGAAIIKGAQDDTTITVNDGVNTVYLGDGSDTVNVGANATGATAQATIDVIHGFTVGDDVIDATGVAGSLAYNSSASSYGTFLTAATNGITTSNYAVYAARVGTDTYVAFNVDADSDLDFVVKLVGVTATINSADVGV